jgi:hypothetical protein
VRRLARTDQIWKLIATWHRRSKSPQEPDGDRAMFSCPSIPRVPRHAFQIAAPGRPDPISWIGSLEYGPGFGSPQARRYRSGATCVGADSRLDDRAEINQSRAI